MEKVLSITNMFLGLFIISLQLSAFAIFNPDWDLSKFGAGISGGFYLVIFSLQLILKKLKSSKIVLVMAVLGALNGVLFIGFYSWSIDGYQPFIADCNTISISPFKICERAAIDSLMIICGILALIVNGIIAAKSSSFAYVTPMIQLLQ